jgi:hypothetical protein
MREYKEFANKAIPFLTLYEEGDNGLKAIIEFTYGTPFGIYRKMSFPSRPHARNEVANPAFSTTAHVLLELPLQQNLWAVSGSGSFPSAW